MGRPNLIYENEGPDLKAARLTSEAVAKRLGFAEHDIPVLVSKGLIEPLGKPAPNAVKYFAACEIEVLAKNAEWLHKATQAIYNHWRVKNKGKGTATNDSPRNNVYAAAA